QRPIASVAVVFMGYQSQATLNRNRILRLIVDKINHQEGVPIVAHAGDVVTFDHVDNLILLNGQDITREKAFIGEYFAINPGLNTLVAEPEESIGNINVRWRNRWR